MRFALLLVLLAGCATAKSTAPSVERLDFALPNTTGQTVSNADFAGKVVLIDFWATWCKPCEASFPFYDELAKAYAEDGFEIVAISVDEEDEAVARFLETHPVSFTILRDPEGTIPERLDLKTMPTAVLVGRDGKVVHVHEGFFPEDEDLLEQKIAAALGTTPGAPKTP